jgi:hypothetical protein
MTKKEAIGAVVGVGWTALVFWAHGFGFDRGEGLSLFVVMATIIAGFGASAARG